ncbi:hypothetical protein KSP39_PZI008349 [Platanthera zijinensis]|uniref:Uncharacterized protein n=1 Tax=Platanthera zijinensis TaxID=2320716 RepID=A0AAP0G8P1_9ASPA
MFSTPLLCRHWPRLTMGRRLATNSQLLVKVDANLIVVEASKEEEIYEYDDNINLIQSSNAWTQFKENVKWKEGREKKNHMFTRLVKWVVLFRVSLEEHDKGHKRRMNAKWWSSQQ